MAIPPILCVNYRFSGAVQVYRLLDGTSLDPIGNPIAVGLEVVPASPQEQSPLHNKVIQFKGELYVKHAGEIYRFNSGTDNWDLVQTLTSHDIQHAQAQALHVSTINGVEKLFVFYQLSSSASARFYETTDGSSWTQTDGGTWNGFNIYHRPVFYDGRMFVPVWTGGSGMGAIVNLNDKTMAFPGGTMPNGSRQRNRPLCVFEDRLLLLTSNTSTGRYELWEWTLGISFQLLQVLTTGSPATISELDDTAPELFTDGTGLFALYPALNGGAQREWFMVELTSTGGEGTTFTETDRSGAVLPASWKANGLMTGSLNQVETFLDDETDPLNPTVYIFRLSTAGSGGTRNVWQFNGNAALLSRGDFCPAGANFSLGMPKMGGGERIWSSGDLDIQIESLQTTPTGTRINYTVYGDAGTDDKIVKFFYAAGNDFPDTQCTLVAASATGNASNVVGNQIEDVDADDGVTTYTVVWDVVTDGFAAGERAQLKGQISP